MAKIMGPLGPMDPVQGTFGQDMRFSQPGWARWLDALKAQGVDKISAAPSAPGSNQLRGFSAQPDYSPTGATFMGRPNANYQPMLQKGQKGADGTTFQQEQKYLSAIKGLRTAGPQPRK